MPTYTKQQLREAFQRAKMRGDETGAAAIQAELERQRADAVGAVHDENQRFMKEARRSTAAQGDNTLLSDAAAFGKNLAPAAGAGIASVMRAIGMGRVLKAIGLPDTKEEATQNDAALMDAPGGSTGYALGQAAPAALAIPFTPATIPGALAAGGVTGGLMTEGDLGDRALGATLGAAGGGAGALVAPVARAGAGFVRGGIEPLRQAGRTRIVGRSIDRFAEDPNAISQLINPTRQGPMTYRTLTGAEPTLAELTGDRGLATLQRAVMTDAAQSAGAGQLAARQEANNAARLATLRGVAGQGDLPVPTSSVRALQQRMRQPSLREAEGARAAAAQRSYGEAYDAGIVPGAAEAMAPQLEQLMSRPSIEQARGTAVNMARESGLAEVPENSVRGLHFLKKALDDQALGLPPGSTQQGLVRDTAGDLASTLEDLSPLYQNARREFQNNSVPVQRAEVTGRLLDAGQNAIRDMSGNRTLSAQKFSNALNDEAKLIKGATGYKGTSPEAALSDTLQPWQIDRIAAVRNELELLSNLDRAAAGPGSHTAKMLSAQNLMRQTAGPLGLPESFMSNVISEQMQRLPTAVMYRSADQRIGDEMAQVFLDPRRAAAAVRAAREYDMRRAPSQLELLTRRAAPTAIGLSAADLASQ